MTAAASGPAAAATGQIESAVTAWVDRQDISARSVLVTVLGDALVPLGGAVWLGDLFTLTEPLGFSERLVRTSMSRLVAEDWVEAERVGRRSRYSLTAFAEAEFADAEARIYRRSAPSWDGLWTLVLLDPSSDGSGSDLDGHGFGSIDRNTLASPTADVTTARRLLEGLAVSPIPPIATARFDEAGPLDSAGPYRATSGLEAAEAAYELFVDRYHWMAALPAVEPRDAFIVRTMLVHDLRRARLRDPQLPAALLPADWVGHRAMTLAASVYRAVADASWRFITDATDLSIDPTNPSLAARFADTA